MKLFLISSPVSSVFTKELEDRTSAIYNGFPDHMRGLFTGPIYGQHGMVSFALFPHHGIEGFSEDAWDQFKNLLEWKVDDDPDPETVAYLFDTEA